ncbi:MAG: ArgE/DapE family deacylase [Wenzhouxiangellaceae bacterium]|nr:MAG: ArgE/DapE family deacylase [Wenzhouxiangellaceae bacterium]
MTLSDLIAYASDHGRETAIQHHMAGLLAGMGMRTDVWEIDLDSLREHPAYGAEIEREQALGVVGSWGGRRGKTLILNGHVDVVPPGEPGRWSVPPFQATVRDGRVYGRGAVDMKGGLCCAIHAVRAIMDAGLELAGEVMIQPVVGEEDGGAGTLAAVVRGHRADAAIVLEPTEMAIAPAQGGALSFRITVPGLAAHGALRTEGVDPMDFFDRIHRRLRALEQARNERLRHPLFADYAVPYAICVGKVQAGIWASTVAETLVLEGRYGVGIDEDPDQARAELDQAIADLAATDPWLSKHPMRVEWWGARFMPAAIPVDDPIVTELSSAWQAACGQQAMIRGMPYGADMHLLVKQGQTPTVLFGPGDVRLAHAPDEYVPIRELEAVTRTLVLTILRFCGLKS